MEPKSLAKTETNSNRSAVLKANANSGTKSKTTTDIKSEDDPEMDLS